MRTARFVLSRARIGRTLLMTRNGFFGGTVLALCVVLGAGASPGCSCNPNNGNGIGGDGGNGDGGPGGGGDGGLNACGDNDPSCTTVCLGPTCVPPGMFPLPTDSPPNPNVGADGVTRDPNGYIILDQSHAGFDFLWVADDVNWGDGTVSKISTKPRSPAYPSGRVYGEVARYPTVTCMSNAGHGSNEGQVFSQVSYPQPALCADGVNGCCTRSEAFPGAKNGHQAVNLKVNRPSRTAVDFNGDVWVANRAFGLQSSVTKIANDITECVDRNSNGKIDTSEDVNQDGIITTDCNGDNIADNLSTVCTNGLSRPEFLGYDDECVLFTTSIGTAVNLYGRPLTLGQGATDFAPADAWAGTWVDGKFFRIDGTTGLIKTTVQINTQGGVAPNPYGAAIDQFGILWAPNEGQTHLFYFDTNNPTNQGMVTAPASVGPGTGFYGIAIDGFKDTGGNLIQQVWLGNVSDNPAGAYRYRPNRAAGFAGLGSGTWARAIFPGGSPSQGRGVGVDNRDVQGGAASAFAWVALDGYINNVVGGIGRIPTNIPDGITMMTAGDFFLGGQHGTLGSGVAIDLDIWGINQSEGSMSHFKVDAMGNVLNGAAPDIIPLDDRPASAEASCPVPACTSYGVFGASACSSAGGVMECKVHPYTYSDFTGFGLRNFTNPHGTYSWTQMGCGPGKSKWLKVLWDADIKAGTNITMRARSSDDNTTLGQATFTGDYPSTMTGANSVADLSQAPGPLMPNPSGFIQVEFDLTTTDKSVTPALKSFTILWECLSSVN
jgi:hypothetical protein